MFVLFEAAVPTGTGATVAVAAGGSTGGSAAAVAADESSAVTVAMTVLVLVTADEFPAAAGIRIGGTLTTDGPGN